MTYSTIILAAAKLAKVSGALLLAICTQESNLTNAYVLHDGGSPSIGVCQIKYETAKMLGYKGKAQGLMDAKTNAKFAALYLKYQESRYGDDWVKLASSYNAGSYTESKKVVGCPRNLRYVKNIGKIIHKQYARKLYCGIEYAP